MVEKQYMNTVYYGNDELVYLTTRSLCYDKQKNIIFIDRNRYIDELKLYRYLKEKKVGSLFSSLLPIILANDSVENSFLQTYTFFQWIRKNTTTVEEYLSLYLLCTFIKNETITKENIFNFNSHTLLNKQEIISLERLKIKFIMEFNSILEHILVILEPNNVEFNQNILTHLYDSIEEPNKMCQYFIRLKKREISSSRYNGLFNIEKILHLDVGESFTDALLGQIFVSSKTKDEITLESKRGEIRLDPNR